MAGRPQTFEEWWEENGEPGALSLRSRCKHAWGAAESERTRTLEIRLQEMTAERNENVRLAQRHEELRRQTEAQCERLRADVQAFKGSTGPQRSTLAHIHAEVIRARMKHPGNKHLLGALTEEVGELAQALLDDLGPHEVYAEATQVACVAIRIMEEGDGDYE